MNEPTKVEAAAPRLRVGIVLRVQEETCEIIRAGQVTVVGYAKVFPSPRVERVMPGHLVAVTGTPDGSEVVVWRWFDAVVLGAESGMIRLWEPAHGEVVARPRSEDVPLLPGTRAYLSAGLPGADWWVSGSAVGKAEDARVELDRVESLYTDRDLWNALT